MNPGIPQPDPLPLTAPPAVFLLLLLLTFTLHLLPMNAVLGGSIIGAVARWRGRQGRAHHAELARLIGKLLPVTMAAAVTLGVAALLFLQVLYGRVFFSSSVVMASFWIAVIPLLIVAYYAAYGVAFDRRGGTERTGLAWLIVAIVLAVAFIYTNNMTLMLRPGAQHALYAQASHGLHWNSGDPTRLPRFLHMLAGAVAVAGLSVALIGFFRRRVSPEFGIWAMAYGCRWFVLATAANFLIGMWLLSALPEATMALFVGGSGYATVALALGIVAAIDALAFALGVGQSPEPSRLLIGAWIATIVAVALMVLSRDSVRRSMLDAAGFQPVNWASPQWGPIAIFAVLLVVAIVLVAWMVTALVKAPSPQARGVAQV